MKKILKLNNASQTTPCPMYMPSLQSQAPAGDEIHDPVSLKIQLANTFKMNLTKAVVLVVMKKMIQVTASS